MVVFGLTGNTGTGKTTVGDALRARGIPVVDADRIARQVVRPGEPALEEIRAAFGMEFIDENGELRRQALGRLIFGDPEAKARLEAITHPRIAERVREELQTHRERKHPIAVYDSAVLVETGLADAFAGLIVVTAERPQQIARIMARDGLSRADAEQRMKAQLPLERKVALADYVIDNSGSLENLERQVADCVEWMQDVATNPNRSHHS